MILTTLESLKTRVGAPNVASTDAKCGALLQAATNYVAAYLYTNFEHQTEVKDVFILRKHDYRARTHTIKLELTNNLVDAGAITCKVAASRYQLKQDNSVEVDELDYEVDATNGIISLLDWTADNQVIEVTYTKGLMTEDDGNGFQIAVDAPSWLAEAALVTAAYHYLLPQIESEDEMCHGLPCEARQLLDPYRRNWQNAYQVC